ncbi:MAG: transcriptional regulator LldR [Achromobacter sp.]|uniref:transcriptional regulator LldR n=1 Tax=Achromobacter sp. TaxID=134375 RepID=UPI0012C11838|nr:transcriptional regulator LldR [Achromobacter sp.]
MRLSDQVAEKLLSLIQAQDIPPGGRLPAERGLAQSLGVSRTALREAIQKLSSHGILTSRVGAGTFLAADARPWPQQSMSPLGALMQQDPQYRYDVLESRYALESSTASYAAQRATDADKAKIQRCFDQMVQHQQRGNAELSAHADAQFHLAIAEASHNLVLLQIMRGLFDLMLSTVAQNRRNMLILDSPASQDKLTHQHQALMQSILDGDPEQARAVIGQHLDYIRATLIKTDEDAARHDRSTRLPSPMHP